MNDCCNGQWWGTCVTSRAKYASSCSEVAN